MTRYIVFFLLLLALRSVAQVPVAHDATYTQTPIVAPAPVKRAFEAFLATLKSDTAHVIPMLATDPCEDYVLIWSASMNGARIEPYAQDSLPKFCGDLAKLHASTNNTGKRGRRNKDALPVSYRLDYNSSLYKVIVVTREINSIDETVYYYARKRTVPPR